MYNFTIKAEDLFIDSAHIDNAPRDYCYMAMFNFGKLADIDKRNKWVFGKYVTKDYYMIFDATVKEEDNDAWLQIGIGQIDMPALEERR